MDLNQKKERFKNIKNPPRDKTAAAAAAVAAAAPAEEFVMPTFNDYKWLHTKNYKVADLKHICRFYKLKMGCNKAALTHHIFNFLFMSKYALIIQRNWRRYFNKKVYQPLHGPARFNRRRCINGTEFFTMEDLADIPYTQFFSFADIDTMIYGFEISSLKMLIDQSKLLVDGGENVLNPYNRNIFPVKVLHDFQRLLLLSPYFGEKIMTNINHGLKPPSSLLIRINTLFNTMDGLGNYTDANWFHTLDRLELIRFIRELYDIWVFRAQLTNETKLEICPPHGDPFANINLFNLPGLPLEILQETIFQVMEKISLGGINRENKCLGTNYVLCALTLVNMEAAIALPWLYHSVAHFV
jgi:hypothetical protein